MKYLFSCSFFFAFILFSSNVQGQDELLSTLEVIKKLESDSAKLENYIVLLTQLNQENDTNAKATLYQELGGIHSKLRNYEKSIDFFLKAIRIHENLEQDSFENLNESRYALSQIYKKLGRVDSQNLLLNSIIEKGSKDIFTCKAHADIGRNIAVKGDYLSALQYLNSVLADAELMQSVDHELLIRLKITYIYSLKYESIFKADENSPDLDNLKKHQIIIEKKIESSNLNPSLIYSMHNNLANVYEAFDGGLDVALESYFKMMNYFKEEQVDYNVHLALGNIGNVYAKQKLFNKAKSCYYEVIENSKEPDLIAAAYESMGFFLNFSESKSRIPYFIKAFNVLLGRKIGTNDSISLPTLEEVRSSVSETDFLIYLIDLSSILVQSYYETKDDYYLHKSKESIYLIDQLVSQIRYESLSEESKLYWIERGVDTYMLGVKVCYLLGQKEEAFYFMEKNKALLLQESIKTLQAKWALDIPEETLEREYDLYNKRFGLYEIFQRYPENLKNKNAYAQINIEYTEFMDSLELIFPDYTKTKKQVRIATLDEAIGNYVSKDQVLVEYILNDKNGYGIMCAANEKLLFGIPDVEILQSELSELKGYWTESILSKTRTADFRKLAYSVFSKLLPFPNAFEKLNGKQITIISDQNLHHLPFEAFPIKADLDLADSYFINFSDISYLHSISVTQEIEKKKNNPNKTLLGLAPFQFHYAELQTLSESKESIIDLSKFQSSKILIDEDATKKNFLAELNDYKVIHLNTHAGIDSFNLKPWIAFRNEKMGLSELYGKENQAELVVLDACKTNDGELALGEGIFNLSRGFFFNGTKSVLASMWNVNEQSGNEIIKSFYDNLQEGKTKSKALQMAKIDYLEKHQYSKVLPYYWAAYTLTGNTSPVELRQNSNRVIYFGMGFLAVVLFFVFRARFVVPKR